MFAVLICFLLVPREGLGQGLSASETYQEAYDRGYEDGAQSGKEDQEGGHLFDFANKKAFQRANHGSDESRRDWEVYLVAYRLGFEDGYEAGFGLVDRNQPYISSSSSGLGTDELPTELDSSAIPAEKTLTVPSGTRVRIRLRDALSTRRNERGDDFRAEVVEDVSVGQRVLVPIGTRVHGSISNVKRAGRIKGRAKMNLRFDSLEFRRGNRVSIQARVVLVGKRGKPKIKNEEGSLEGEGTKSKDARRVGNSSAIGVLIGVLTGGKRGAKRGAMIGAVAGLAGVLTSRGRDLEIWPRTEMVIELDVAAEIPESIVPLESP